MAIIYQITNLVNGKIYIGATRFNLAKRWSEHRYKASGTPRSWFHRSIKKYGADNFKTEEIVSCIGDSDKDWSSIEQEIIKDRKPEYNMTNGGEITVGRKTTKEVVEKIRLKNTGKKRTAEQNEAMSNLKKEHYRDPEIRAKNLLVLEKGRLNIDRDKQREAIRKAGREGRLSWSMSEERKARQLANLNTPEARAKMAESMKKPVECTTLNAVFDSVSAAAEYTGIHISSISKICSGKRNSAYGLKFQYA